MSSYVAFAFVSFVAAVAGAIAAAAVLHGGCRRLVPWAIAVGYALVFPAAVLSVWIAAGPDLKHYPVMGTVVVFLGAVVTVIASGWPFRLFFAWQRQSETVGRLERRLQRLEGRALAEELADAEIDVDTEVVV